MQYPDAVKEYFKEKGERFLRKYKSFEDLKSSNSTALAEWTKIKDEIKHHAVYHKHANLSPAFKTIKKKIGA